MLTPVRSAQFKRDVKRAKKRGKDLSKLRTLLSLLIERKPLPASSFDHPLKGNWKGYRDVHIAVRAAGDGVESRFGGEIRSHASRRANDFNL